MTKKLIPFSLAEWEKQNRSIECLVCRNGVKPIDAHWFERRKSEFKMFIVLDNNSIASTDSAGKLHGNSTDSGYDLFIEIDVPDVIEVRWMNLYSNFISGNWHKSKEKCDEHADKYHDRYCYIKITVNVTTGEKTIEIIPL